MKKEIKLIIKGLRAKGWLVDKSRNHWMAKHPSNGQSVLISATPSCHHALKNITSDIRRAEQYEL